MEAPNFGLETQAPRRCADVVDVGRLEISNHALSRYQLRTGATLVEAAAQLRTRVSESHQINDHSTLQLGRGKKYRSNTAMYFQDPQDGNLVYVVAPPRHEKRRIKDRGKFVVTSALHA